MLRKSDITCIDDKKKELKKELYTKLYEQLSRKIRQAVEFGQKQVILSVPGFLFGYPVFDRFQATEWLSRQLVLGEFAVTRIDDFTFYVSWEKKTTDKPSRTQAPTIDEEEFDFPTLINLKKAANKNRKYFPGSS